VIIPNRRMKVMRPVTIIPMWLRMNCPEDSSSCFVSFLI
jgi:hypothetical protein